MKEITAIMNLKNEHTTKNRKYRCEKNLKDKIKKDSRYATYKVKKKTI